MRNIDLFIFIAYLVGIVLFGISFYKKGRTSTDYSTGSGTIPAWVIGLSIFATFVSSISYLALPGGISQFIEVASRYDKFSLGSLGTSLTESTFWVVFIYGIFINLQNYGIDQNFVQRYMSARNDKEAVSSALGGGLLYVPVSLLFFIIGTGLFVYYQVYSEALPPEFRETGMSDSVFPFFIVNVLPAGLTGLLIASIFAAGMSTISTSLNSSATVILNDYYKRIKKDMTEGESVRVLYISSALISIAGIIISFYIIRVESALDVW